jgi:hypothetical protein
MPSSNTAEKVAGLYLRLNGFLQLPLFTLFYEDKYGQIDILGIHGKNSVEKAMGVEFPVDDAFFEACKRKELDDPKGTILGVVAEVRGNNRRKAPDVEHVQYAANFLGEAPIIRVSFSDSATALGVKDGVVVVSMRHATEWIRSRVKWMESQGWRFTKSGSWSLSDDYLSDILYDLGREWGTFVAGGDRAEAT